MNDLVLRLVDITRSNPKHLAIVDGDREVSYAEFLDLVNSMVAAFAPILDASKNKCIAIALAKGPHAYAAMFATLMAGGFYVPIDLQLPKSRIDQVLDSVSPAILLSDTSIKKHSLFKADCIDVSDLKTGHILQFRPPHELAYVKFTSGSTGQPKGVIISQKAVSNYINWVLEAFRPSEIDRWSQHPNIAFDICVTDIFGALTTGGTLFPITQQSDITLPAELVKENRITIWNSVPSVFSTMSKVDQVSAANLSSVRFFNFCGEPLYRSQVEEIFAAVPDAKVQNSYGPTESTVACKASMFTKKTFEGYKSPTVELGKDLPGVITFVEKEELVISGIQLANGYWLEKKLTEEKFLTNIFEGKKIRCYFSGDIVKFDTHGRIFFVERKDQQVKIRGHRVELGEITAAIKGLGYSECYVSHWDGIVVAFICADALDEETLFKGLQEKLHLTAIPSKYVLVDEMPRTKNNKLDAKKLIELYRQKLPQ